MSSGNSDTCDTDPGIVHWLFSVSLSSLCKARNDSSGGWPGIARVGWIAERRLVFEPLHVVTSYTFEMSNS